VIILKIKFVCAFCQSKNEVNSNLRKTQTKTKDCPTIVIDTVSIKCKDCGKKNFATPTENRRKK